MNFLAFAVIAAMTALLPLACGGDPSPGTPATPPGPGTDGGPQADGASGDSGSTPDVPTPPMGEAGLAIAPHTVPDGVVGIPYSQVLQAAMATSSAVWSIEAGALPAGLALSGAGPSATIEGTPAAAGTFAFQVKVTDETLIGTLRLELVVADAQVIFVDGQLSQDSCTTYSEASRGCAGGSRTAYRTLAGASANAGPGDAVVLREGSFHETLAPSQSGTQSAPIRWMRYGAETPTISGAQLEPAIELTDRSWLVIQGLSVTGVRRWMYARRTHHCVIQNNAFDQALDTGGSSKTGLFFEEATYNRVRSNTVLDSTQDNVSLVKSDFNVVEFNTIRKAAHTLWTIKCGNRNVIRGNRFHNELEKIGEIFDCEDVGFDHQFFLLDATKYNLVEQNDFAFTPSSGDHSPYAGIQYAGQHGIIRRNVFHDTVGPGLDLTQYAQEARYCTDNRVYHNVFYATSFAGLSAAGEAPDGYGFSGNLLVNNVFFKSSFVANDTRWQWYTSELAGKPVQIMLGGLLGVRFEGNDILGSEPGQPYAITLGRRDSTGNPAQHELAWWEANHPEVFTANREVLPGFENEAARDFRPAQGSALLDAGSFVTRTAGAGSGTSLDVLDAGWFFDGFGIPGETGDEVQLEGQATPARVVAVDYEAHTLTLEQPLTWTAGLGVALRYSGKAPDQGAFERP